MFCICLGGAETDSRATDDAGTSDNWHFSRKWLEVGEETRHGPSPNGPKISNVIPPLHISSPPQIQGPTSPKGQKQDVESPTKSSDGVPSPLSSRQLDPGSNARRSAHVGKHKAASNALVRMKSSKTHPISHHISDLVRLTSPRRLIPMSQIIDSMASLSHAGWERAQRKTNQDSCFAFRHYIYPFQAFAGVMDGHGPNGHGVSGFVRRQLPLLVARQMQRKDGADAASALRSAFLDIHDMIATGTGGVSGRLSGTTAVVTILQGVRLTTAWVGDSRAILLRREAGGKLQGVSLTHDHKPTSSGELSRILGAGGRVERLVDGDGREIGPFRVWLSDSWIPGLAMSRALGDIVAHSVGVIAEPEVHSCDLSDSDEYLVIASDGVWEFMNAQDVANLITDGLHAEEACKRIVEAASERWKKINEISIDDISVVVARLKPAQREQ